MSGGLLTWRSLKGVKWNAKEDCEPLGTVAFMTVMLEGSCIQARGKKTERGHQCSSMSWVNSWQPTTNHLFRLCLLCSSHAQGRLTNAVPRHWKPVSWRSPGTDLSCEVLCHHAVVVDHIELCQDPVDLQRGRGWHARARHFQQWERSGRSELVSMCQLAGMKAQAQ